VRSRQGRDLGADIILEIKDCELLVRILVALEGGAKLPRRVEVTHVQRDF
jgi:hypothetical protein